MSRVYLDPGRVIPDLLINNSEFSDIREYAADLNKNLNDIMCFFLGKRELFGSISVLSGESGTALLYAQLYLITQDKVYLKELKKVIDFLIDNLNHSSEYNSTSPYFSNGLAGFGWLLCYIKETNILKIPECFLKQIDEALLYSISQSIGMPWDILHGRLSISRYFLKRNMSKNVENDLIYLENIADTGKQVCWKSENRSYINKYGDYYDCGYAHGMGGILYFVTKAYKQNINRSLCRKLGDGIINFYRHNEQDFNRTGSYYPNRIFCDSKNLSNTVSRLAWCYGDLTILYAMYCYCYIIENELYRNIVIEKLKKTAHRTECVNNGVYDAMICHGSAGIAHIYHRLYCMTNIIEFKTAAIYWLKITTSISRDESVFPPFKFVYSSPINPNVLRQESYGLLEGLAGVGLVISSFYMPQSMDWDEVIMLS